MLAKRRGVWRAIVMRPAAYHARIDLTALGQGKKVRLRLVASDGVNTTTVNAKPSTPIGRNRADDNRVIGVDAVAGCPERQLGVSVTVNAAPPAPSYGLAFAILAVAVGS